MPARVRLLPADLAHARRRAGEDKIAGQQLVHAPEMGDDLLDAPGRLIGVALLHDSPSNLEADRAPAEVAHGLGGVEGPPSARGQRRTTRGTSTAPAFPPRPRDHQHISSITTARARDLLPRLLGQGVAAALAQRHHELDLVIQDHLGHRRIRTLRSPTSQRLRRLPAGEEKQVAGGNIHLFAGMLGIVRRRRPQTRGT